MSRNVSQCVVTANFTVLVKAGVAGGHVPYRPRHGGPAPPPRHARRHGRYRGFEGASGQVDATSVTDTKMRLDFDFIPLPVPVKAFNRI